jgi:tRNA-splicing ligase RtcB (3'-phosphate/5'-hydroxy nucleic acid ligase)
MNKVISSERIPIKMWLDDMEEGALEQARNLANLPFVFKWISIMPDSHQGYGMPIGGVMATEKVIIPNAVGVDIGCGMCAVKTSLTDIDLPTLKKIMGKIREAIPVGFNKHKGNQDRDFMPPQDPVIGKYPVIAFEFENALKQVGTLGGGNHFIEIQKGDDGHIWIMIHSGSRALGFKTAKHYNNLAIDLNSKWYSSVPKEHELAFLPMDSNEGKNYINEMSYCVEFALANRSLMMDRVLDAVNYYVEETFSTEPTINIAHNYAKMENHYGKNVMVHRKGATSAREGELGIIPGSQGTNSYIVKGKGNPESFESCSHGAGRKMGRKQAQRELNLLDEQAKLVDVIHSVRTEKDLDEAPGSYKNIDVVMSNQTDLVEVVIKLTPLAVIKG